MIELAAVTAERVVADADRVITNYVTETEDGRVFLVQSFADEDFHMMLCDEDGLTMLGRYDSLAAAQYAVRRVLNLHCDA